MLLLAEVKAFFLRTSLAKVVCLASALIACWEAGLGFMTYRSYQTAIITSPPNVNSVTQYSTQDNLNQALQSPIFRVYVPQNLADGNVKRSLLNVRVVGVMFASREDESQVILRLSSGEEQSFRVGERLPEGALIKRITQDGILIEYQGVLESLSLPKQELNFEPPAKPLIGP